MSNRRPNHEIIRRALSAGCEVLMGEVLSTGQRSTRVTMALEESTGREVPAIVATRERPGMPNDEVLLGLDENVFMLWCSQMSHDEEAGISAGSVLMQMANESIDKRNAYHAARSTEQP